MGIINEQKNKVGRPSERGATEMVSKRLPVELMNKVRNSTKNVTQFIIDALNEKLEKAS